MRGYLPLILKDSITHMYGLAVYVKEGLPFAQDLLLENSADSYLYFRLAFPYQSPSWSLCMVFDSISSNLDEVLSINPSANVFVSVIIFLSQMTLLRWLTFLPGFLTVTLSPALLDFFLSSDTSICSTMAFPSLGNSDHVVVSVSIDFPLNSKQDAPFHCIAYDYSRADWDGLRDHLRDVPWEDIFKLSASAAASEFCEWV